MSMQIRSNLFLITLRKSASPPAPLYCTPCTPSLSNTVLQPCGAGGATPMLLITTLLLHLRDECCLVVDISIESSCDACIVWTVKEGTHKHAHQFTHLVVCQKLLLRCVHPRVNAPPISQHLEQWNASRFNYSSFCQQQSTRC